MQLSLSTPTQATFEKKVHTPPSIDRRDSLRPKLTKGLSGKLFKRQSELEANSCNTFDSAGLFVPAFSLSSSKKRAPKPLNLSHPITPPPSLRKTSTTSASPYASSLNTSSFHNGAVSSQLESPIHLTPSVKIRNLENPLDCRGAYNLSPGVSPRHREHPVIWTETADDPFLEEGSPTYLCDVSENISRVKTKTGHRRFAKSICTLCDEKMSSILAGEKIIEMTCSHACHYECYFTMLESLYCEKKYPCCTVCLKLVKPVDQEILEEMVSCLLTKRSSFDKQSYVIEPQNIYSKLVSSSGHNLFTPKDQLIKTGDISCNGFKASFDARHSYSELSCDRSATSEVGTDVNGECGTAFSNSRNLLSSLVNSANDSVSMQHSGIHCNAALETDNGFGPVVEINKDKDCVYSVTVKTLEDRTSVMSHSVEMGAKLQEDGTQSLKEEVESHVKQQIDPDDQFTSLVIFDMVDYSTDGEQWTENIMAYLFKDYLILFDHGEMTTAGKVPVKEMCQVLRMDDQVLLIDLKSRKLPQIYLSFQAVDDQQHLVEKWRYYMSGGVGSSYLEHMTSTAWGILPLEMQGILQNHFKTTKQNVNPNNSLRPWESNSTGVLLQLIICLNICDYKSDEQNTLTDHLQQLLNSLNDDDLLGLVVVGKDGKGNIGQYGTFTGTISKKWDCWNDIFDGMKTHTKNIFPTERHELDKMLETCFRLVSTSDTMLEKGQLSRYVKQIVLIRNGEPPSHSSKYYSIIKNNYKFDILQISSFPGKSIGRRDKGNENLIHTLRNKSIKDLTVTFDGNKISYGNMQQGEEKSVTTTLFNVNLNQTHAYTVEWFDRRTQIKRTSKGVAEISAAGDAAPTSKHDGRNAGESAYHPQHPQLISSFLREMQMHKESSGTEAGLVPTTLQLAL